MTVPCSCKIPDPIVVNGTCLICYGERPSVPDQARAFASVCTDDSQDEPPDFDIPNDDFGS